MNEKKAVTTVVQLAQENLLLRQIVKETIDFICQSGTLNFSAKGYAQRKMMKNYFANIALEKLIDKGYDMGVNTPWGKDAAKLVTDDFFDPLEESEEDDSSLFENEDEDIEEDDGEDIEDE